jgi:hypothetical protein
MDEDTRKRSEQHRRLVRENPPLHKGKRFALWCEGREDPTRPGVLATGGSDCVVDLRTGREADPEDVVAYIAELETAVDELKLSTGS